MKIKVSQIAILSTLATAGLSYANTIQIKAGDTLTQIAESNYGNWIKWKDLWKLNQDHISNPDLIYPGQRLKLFTEEELAEIKKSNPQMAQAFSSSSANDADGDMITPSRRKGKSNEWRLLPLQGWEKFVFKKSAEIDPDGFDRRSKVMVRTADKANAAITISSDRIPVLGEVTNARSDYDRLFLGDQLFIRADEPLQVGTIYSVTSGPQKIVSKRDGRVGFGYDLTGKVRIIGVRDGLFIGTITALYFPIRRHHLLIPEVPAYSFPEAVAAPLAVQASMVVPSGVDEEMIGQEKIVFLDVGIDDGVKAGMIFRHYLHRDPYTDQEITAKDFLIEAEVKVLWVLDKFSVAIVTGGRSNMHFGDELVALTDLTDYEKNQGLQTVLQDSGKQAVSVDDLDQMDTSDGLGEKENHDLRQLEKWAKPSPNANVPLSDDDIIRVDTHDHPKETYEIGKEPAPNDGSAKKPETAPTPPPTSPEPGPMTPTEPSVVTPSTPPADMPTTTTPPETTNAPPTTTAPSNSAPTNDTLPPPPETTPGSTTTTPAAGDTTVPGDPFSTPPAP